VVDVLCVAVFACVAFFGRGALRFAVVLADVGVAAALLVVAGLEPG
jgi:hypothetical protein